ncbi:hypothetical protein GCM10022288_15650 [Gryllotalpicola kribbensis]|uniref:Uncharacterized protein n=1 Tax=Gryllotalpicola kribbensis TaxID=993084 RepID=A0ABP8AS96_9MICO
MLTMKARVLLGTLGTCMAVTGSGLGWLGAHATEWADASVNLTPLTAGAVLLLLLGAAALIAAVGVPRTRAIAPTSAYVAAPSIEYVGLAPIADRLASVRITDIANQVIRGKGAVHTPVMTENIASAGTLGA